MKQETETSGWLYWYNDLLIWDHNQFQTIPSHKDIYNDYTTYIC